MAAVALAAALTLPIHAHTVEQLETWDQDWHTRASVEMTVDLMDERRDMRARHPWHFDPEPEVRVAARLIVAPPPRPPSPGVEAWRPLVEKYWPAELVPWAMAIIQCESQGDPYADNPYSTARGLFQFLRSTWDRGPAPALGLPSYDSGAPYNGEWNIQAAAWLYANWGGVSQWQCKAA